MAVARRRSPPTGGHHVSQRHYGGHPGLRDADRSMDTAYCTGFTITPRGGESPLNADPAAQRHLLDLQAADLDLDQLAHRRAALPEAAEAEELARAHVRLRDQHVTVATEIADLE